MRIKLDKPATKKHYDLGYKRVVTKFLFFPKKIKHEIRWLEKASWVQGVDRRIRIYDYGLTEVKKYFWYDLEWFDKFGVESDDDEVWLED